MFLNPTTLFADAIRRYGKLKVMIKRAVMYLKLSNNELVNSPGSPLSPVNGGPPHKQGTADLNRAKKHTPGT